jgi:hypothetical protein
VSDTSQTNRFSRQALLFGSKTHAISTPRDSHYCDLYQSDPSKSEARLSRLPNPAMAIFPRFGPPAQREAWERSEKLRSEREAKAKTTSKATDVRNVFGTKADDALERLSSQFAAFEENKKQYALISPSLLTLATSRLTYKLGQQLSVGFAMAKSARFYLQATRHGQCHPAQP